MIQKLVKGLFATALMVVASSGCGHESILVQSETASGQSLEPACSVDNGLESIEAAVHEHDKAHGTQDVVTTESADSSRLATDPKASDSPKGIAEEELEIDEAELESLESRLKAAQTSALRSSTYDKLSEKIRDAEFMWAAQQDRLLAYGFNEGISVYFDSAGEARPLIGSAGGVVVAEYVHSNRAAYLDSLINATHFVLDQQWYSLTDDERQVVEQLQSMSADEQQNLLRKHEETRQLLVRPIYLEIRTLRRKLRGSLDVDDVEKLIRRANLFASIDCWYLAWCDAARTLELDPIHKDHLEISAIETKARLRAVRQRPPGH